MRGPPCLLTSGARLRSPQRTGRPANGRDVGRSSKEGRILVALGMYERVRGEGAKGDLTAMISRAVRTSERGLRWGGLGLAVGTSALALAIVLVSLRPVAGTVFSPTEATLFLFAGVSLVVSLPALYAAQADRGGLLALVAHVLLEVGTVLFIALAAPVLLVPTWDGPFSDNIVLFVLAIALAAGLFATAIAMLRARVVPRGAPILVLAAMVGFVFDFFVSEFLPPAFGQVGTALFGILLGVGFAWVGVALWLGSPRAGTGG